MINNLHTLTKTPTWFGSFRHGAVVHLVLKLWPVVIHVDHINVQIDWILYLVTIHIHCMGTKLRKNGKENKGYLVLNDV